MKIICIGRNYADHAKELSNPLPKEPLFFSKPDSAILPKRNPFYIPEFTNDVHYELELVLKINKLGKHIAPEYAHTYYNEIGLGLDLTARDIQQELKKNGHPWEKAKAFDGSAVLGEFIKVADLKDKGNFEFTLEKNGMQVQHGRSADMIFSFDALIAYISQFMTLKIGDLIFTGTPAGVGKLNVGDKLEGFLEGQKLLRCNVK